MMAKRRTVETGLESIGTVETDLKVPGKEGK